MHLTLCYSKLGLGESSWKKPKAETSNILRTQKVRTELAVWIRLSLHFLFYPHFQRSKFIHLFTPKSRITQISPFKSAQIYLFFSKKRTKFVTTFLMYLSCLCWVVKIVFIIEFGRKKRSRPDTVPKEQVFFSFIFL